MRDILVKFTLFDEQEERLRKITQEYNKQGLDFSEDKMFEAIMYSGSSHNINDKFSFHEWQLGIRENLQDENVEIHKETGKRSGRSR